MGFDLCLTFVQICFDLINFTKIQIVLSILIVFVLVFWCLIRFIRLVDVSVQYGGLSRPSDLQNGLPKPALEFTVKGGGESEHSN